MPTLAQLNQMTEADFTAALGAIFEETPAIATRTWSKRPFASVADLHRAMVGIVQAMSPAEQHQLICAHPDLGSRAQMAPASVQEQAGAGLDGLSTAEYERFQQLNAAYRAKFAIPFIMAVAGQNKDAILAAFEERLHHGVAAENQRALEEIFKIAAIRLKNSVAPG